ncbi:MAG: TraE/TraK family type IV conjugative transfer system protein [Pseudobdellovibrionaceae bacterium]
MIRKIQRHWFEVWGQEEAQNRFLKYVLLVLSGLTVALLTTVCVLALRSTPVVVLNPETSVLLFPKAPDGKSLERELIRILKKYLILRHNWTYQTIESKAKEAQGYVASDFREKFLISLQEQIRLAKEKEVSQRLYPDEPEIDLKNKTAVVGAERVLIINGIRAGQPMIFELGFNFGERTADNPEGIYITSEKLKSSIGG